MFTTGASAVLDPLPSSPVCFKCSCLSFYIVIFPCAGSLLPFLLLLLFGFLLVFCLVGYVDAPFGVPHLLITFFLCWLQLILLLLNYFFPSLYSYDRVWPWPCSSSWTTCYYFKFISIAYYLYLAICIWRVFFFIKVNGVLIFVTLI